MFDVLIVGCGVVGAAAAYQLSRYKLSVCVCERYNDVANGCTKANTAILHAGFDCPPGSMEARLNLRGIKLAEEICEKLDVERIPMPTFIIAYDDPHELSYIEELYQRGVANGVRGLRIVDHDEALRLEPGLNPDIKAALYAPGSGIINPWEYCIAMAETAVQNGVEVKLESEVTAIERKADHFVVTTSSGVYEARYVVNAGGGWSAQVYELIGGCGLTQTNFAGQYYILDKSQGEKLHSIVFPCPDEHGFKGICVTPTVHGNLLVGPDCYEVQDGDHVGTDPTTLENLKAEGHRSVPDIDFREVIHEYAGVRPNTQIPDFVIGEAPECPHFINLAGIKSPGLSSAPAIAEELEEILEGCGLVLEKKEHFIDSRRRIRFRALTNEERRELIAKNPLYGRVICRCETVTEGEIVEAIHRPIRPRTIDAIKRRCNAGMGRCQGGFCGPRVHEILARELGVDEKDILMDEQGTFLLTSEIKEVAADENRV
ncbi:MAG: NAD(P)/FAD-dependent oxidoreductase [Lachnospiraceae bacterium]|nr:NAD(P)/FAD-dependent oxidoreductase [Lachnospiraceae bacterium]